MSLVLPSHPPLPLSAVVQLPDDTQKDLATAAQRLPTLQSAINRWSACVRQGEATARKLEQQFRLVERLQQLDGQAASRYCRTLRPCEETLTKRASVQQQLMSLESRYQGDTDRNAAYPDYRPAIETAQNALMDWQRNLKQGLDEQAHLHAIGPLPSLDRKPVDEAINRASAVVAEDQWFYGGRASAGELNPAWTMQEELEALRRWQQKLPKTTVEQLAELHLTATRSDDANQ